MGWGYPIGDGGEKREEREERKDERRVESGYHMPYGCYVNT